MTVAVRHVLVTGGAGLVGANVVARLLSLLPEAQVTILDATPPDALMNAYLGRAGERVRHRTGDVCEPGTFDVVQDDEPVTDIVHAAAVTHVPEWETQAPRRYFDVNLGGTLNVLEWAGRRPGLGRLLYVSTGGVYGTPTRLSPAGPQPEDGPFDPPELYAISKFAAERTVRRVAQLSGLDARAVRLSTVFGPMERPTPGRAAMSLPYLIARAIARRRPLRLTARTLDAHGDFLSSVDVAAATVDLLVASAPRHFVYNVAAGSLTAVRDLLETTAGIAPGLEIELVESAADADFDMDPEQRRARWNAYEIERAAVDLGWSPSPLRDQLRDYLRWALEDPEQRCP